MAKKRSFKKLREHLTSKEVDKKITYLESQMPTNNTAFVFGGDPGNPQGNSFETIVDGETDSTDYSVGESPTSYTEARDTSGLFTTGGDHTKGEYVKTEEPPGDTSYILGPMAAMYYTWSYPWTMIGYIRESDRRMVNLARIDGKLSDWDQSSGFSSYGQITLEQAKWFYNIQKANGNTNDPATYSYRAYYPGPPSAVADAYGRYPCILTGVSKTTPRSVPNATPLDKQGGDNYSAMQAQQQGSGFISFKPDLEWFKKNKKKPKGAPSDWNNMSDDEKANWISQNQPEERFNYEGGRFRPDQNNAQSNRVVNPYSIFDPSQDPLGNIPISQQFNQNLNLNINNPDDFILSNKQNESDAFLAYQREVAGKTDADIQRDIDSGEFYGFPKKNAPLEVTQGEMMKSNPDFRGAGNNKEFKPPVTGNNIANNFLKYGRQLGNLIDTGIENAIDNVINFGKEFNKDVFQPSLRQTANKFGQYLGSKKGFLAGLLISAATDARGFLKTATSGGESATFGREGDFPTFNNTSNESGYTANLSLSLAKSMGSGNTVMMNNSNIDPKSVANKITTDDMIKLFNNNESIANGLPTHSTNANDIINPTGKDEYFGGKGFGGEGGSIMTPFTDGKGNYFILNTADKFLRLGGESGEKFDVTTQTFTDIPSAEKGRVSTLVQQQVESGSLARNIAKVLPGDYGEAEIEVITNEVLNSNTYKTALNALESPLGDFLSGSATGSVNGAAAAALLYSEVKKKLGLTKETELNKLGGFGHVRRQNVINVNDLKPDVKAEFFKMYNISEGVSIQRKREIFGHLTKPVILPETKQKTYKVSPGQRYKNKNKKPEKTNFQDMDKLFNKYDNAPQPFKPQERTSWTKDFIRQNTMQSQEKMNNVLELIGDGKFALQHAMNDYKRMSAKELEQYWGRNPYLYDFYFNNKNYKVTRKEQVEGDFIVFLEDQKGEKINILQSELNEKIQEEKERWFAEIYHRDNPVVTEKGETMFDTIKRRFMEKKDIAPEFPKKAPPKMINGFHPEYGKKANRYKKLDPASANAMPLTGDPETDEIVRKQKTINKIKSMKKKA